MKKFLPLVLTILILFCFFSVQAEENVLKVLTYSSFAVSEDVIKDFEAENKVKVQFIEGGDAPSIVNRAILTRNSPIADVIVGMNDILLARVLKNEILEPYESPELKNIPDEFKSDPAFGALPFDYGHVCINYDTAYFTDHHLAVPSSLDDLISEPYKGLLVVENPTSSGPGQAFFLTTVAKYGEDGFVDYWNKLLANDVQIDNDWSSAYYTSFTAGGGNGPRPMVVSYDTSPAAVPFYSETPMETAPTAAILADGTCYRTIEFLGILKGTKNREMAEKFVDAMLGKRWQEDLPGQMFVYPVNQEAVLPEVFAKFAIQPENPVSLDSALIEEKYEDWIQTWNDEVLVNY